MDGLRVWGGRTATIDGLRGAKVPATARPLQNYYCAVISYACRRIRSKKMAPSRAPPPERAPWTPRRRRRNTLSFLSTMTTLFRIRHLLLLHVATTRTPAGFIRADPRSKLPAHSLLPADMLAEHVRHARDPNLWAQPIRELPAADRPLWALLRQATAVQNRFVDATSHGTGHTAQVPAEVNRFRSLLQEHRPQTICEVLHAAAPTLH